MTVITTRCQRRANRWHVVNRFLTFAVILGGIIMLGLLFVPVLDRTRELKEILEREKQELRVALLLQKKREREVFLLRSDPTYLEMVARDKLDLMKSGEIIFRRLDKRQDGRTPCFSTEGGRLHRAHLGRPLYQ